MIDNCEINVCNGAMKMFLMMAGIKAPKGEYEKRIAICEDCPRKKQLKNGGLCCMECGCCMNVKAKFSTHILENFGRTAVACPLKKW